MKKDARFYMNAVRSIATETLSDKNYTKKDIGGHIKDLVSLDQNPQRKAIAFFSVLRHFIPDELFHRITNGHFQHQGDTQLSIDPDLYSLQEERVGEGEQCHVYKLLSQDPERPSLVAKFEKKWGNLQFLLDRAKKVRSEYEEIRSWFEDIPDFIPEEFRFIGKTPFGGRKGVIVIQKFFGDSTKIKDLFRSVDKGSLLQTLQNNPSLEKTFRAFVQDTLSQLDKDGRMIDILGKDNVALIEDTDGPHLILLDPHVIHNINKVPKEIQKELLGHITYLQEIVEALDTNKDTRL